MVTRAERRFLADHGWLIIGKVPYDLCWLDCSASGWLKVDNGRCICLCPDHALVLEQGAFNGDYDGALPPADSMADDWPWRVQEEVR